MVVKAIREKALVSFLTVDPGTETECWEQGSTRNFALETPGSGEGRNFWTANGRQSGVELKPWIRTGNGRQSGVEEALDFARETAGRGRETACASAPPRI
jgi:hypothetical protein